MYRIFVLDEFGAESTLEYTPYEYRNLMELVYNELWEEWGDCRGQAMCGTCHIEVLSDHFQAIDSFEEHTINGLSNKTQRSRLACQIIPDKSINNMKFKILKDY